MLLFDFNILLISESIWIVDYSKHLTKPYSGLLQFIAVIRYLKHFRCLSTQMHLKYSMEDSVRKIYDVVVINQHSTGTFYHYTMRTGTS
jgi:hypothetical protein